MAGFLTRAPVLGLLGALPASANWLLQCSSCVDQSFFGDETLKENVQDADLPVLLAQLKQIRLREFDHREDEFYNKFFSKRQLGIMTQELQSIMPSAVALLPERRWTNAKGVSNVTKNVMMLRESHILMVTVGSMQFLARRADYWDSAIDKLQKEMVAVVEEQNDNRRKREDMLDQIIRTVAKVEVLQIALVKTEEGFVRLEQDMNQFRSQQDDKHVALRHSLELVSNRTDAQDALIEDFKAEFRAAVEREARLDLVEKRKAAEADVEVALVKRSIEKVRWEEEQKTIELRGEEQRRNEDHNSKLHQQRVAHELAQKKAADLEVMKEQEESNMRQEKEKQKGEKELLLLRLESEEKRAEIAVQEAIERAKVEQEAKIRAARENEDVNLRQMRAEAQEKRQQTLAAIKATADIILSWITAVYSSPQNLMLAIGSVVVAIAGVYLAREMAILLREQLNKRLGRPSLVRSTNRRGTMQSLWIGLLRLLKIRKPHGAEFDDVVLHPDLHQQVMRLADATRSAKKRRMPLQHVMFYGPPGTGKTMVAQRFAEYSGLEYAIMSGGDVAPLEEQAVTELHKLFKWVHRSRRGVLLFIDEADAFLVSRKAGIMSETLRNALTTMLYHTGTPSSQFMLVCATNRPGDLDSAVLDRLDEAVEFGLPDIDARKAMVGLYYDMYISRPLKLDPVPKAVDKAAAKENNAKQQENGAKKPAAGRKSAKTQGFPELPKAEIVDEAGLADAARRLHGFSGREIAKLFTSLQTHVLYSATSKGAGTDFRLRKSMFLEVIDAKVREHERTAEFQVSGYNYENLEQRGIISPPRSPSGLRIPSQPAA
mmetsp:Transcript_40641/g.91683  ORF Transcript_40641/g.91683 Transcript_40641/m.91683 type:complete len:828 (+) Transcript_40641:49-2532(+)